MRRLVLTLALIGALAGCSLGTETPGVPHMIVAPVLDSLFVGDSLAVHQVIYYNAQGVQQDPGTVRWSTNDTSVLHVDSVSGVVVGRKSGFARVIATAQGIQGSALVVSLPPLQITLLMDTLYLMSGDTITVPVHVEHQAPGSPTVWYTATANAVFTIDSATGKDSATAPGGPIQFVAHAALGADTVADSGAVEVVSLSDTIGGKAAYTMFGTVIRSVKAQARATNYPRRGDTLTFRVRAFILQGSSTVEAVVITTRTAVTAPASLPIDSLSPTEALTGGDPVCRPPRNWGTWSTLAVTPRLDALSRQGGAITVTRVVPVSPGFAVAGRFSFPAQRLDMYFDPLGVLPIRGTFVAPLVPTTDRCEPA